MERRFLRYIAVPIISLILLMGMVGCEHRPTEAEYEAQFNAISADSNLSSDEKGHLLNALIRPVDPQAAQFNAMGWVAGVGVVLLLVALALTQLPQFRVGSRCKNLFFVDRGLKRARF